MYDGLWGPLFCFSLWIRILAENNVENLSLLYFLIRVPLLNPRIFTQLR